MPMRFQRRISLGGGMTLNLGKRSASVSLGGRHSRFTVGSRGAHASASLPGTGISYRTGSGHRRGKAQGGSAWLGYLFLFGIGWWLLHLAGIA